MRHAVYFHERKPISTHVSFCLISLSVHIILPLFDACLSLLLSLFIYLFISNVILHAK